MMPLAASAAPTVSFKKPISGATLSGAIRQSSACEVTGSGISKVVFYLDRTQLNTKSRAPWNCELDTRNFPNGRHTLMALAADSAGAAATTQITVDIKNGTTATTSPATTPSTPTAGSIDPADILNWASADVPFSQQGGYAAQVLGTHTAAGAIPDAGIHGTVLPNGESLRLGKEADPLDSTRKALSFQLSYGDPSTSGSKRSELSMAPVVEMNKVYWVAFRAYVRDWGSESSSGLFGTQLHSGNNSLGLSPSFGIYMSGARNFRIETRYSTSTSPSQRNSITVRHGEHPIAFGRWVDFVFKVKHNTSGQGLLQAWVDGNLIVDYRGNLGFNTPRYKDYFKFGLYNWASFSNPRKVLLRSPIVVLDPSGSKYDAATLHARVQ